MRFRCWPAATRIETWNALNVLSWPNLEETLGFNFWSDAIVCWQSDGHVEKLPVAAQKKNRAEGTVRGKTAKFAGCRPRSWFCDAMCDRNCMMPKRRPSLNEFLENLWSVKQIATEIGKPYKWRLLKCDRKRIPCDRKIYINYSSGNKFWHFITFSLPLIFFGWINFALHYIVLTATLKLNLFLFSLHYIKNSGTKLILRYITLWLH